MSAPHVTARAASLVSCPCCHLLCRDREFPRGTIRRCPRCSEILHSRKPDSIARTWALTVSALVFYLPANLLPVTTVTSLGKTQSDTIMSGVIYFISSGLWPIALVIFVASVFVPLLKLTILIFLLITVQCRSNWRRRDRARLYRITETIGRWSMVDIFVVTLLVALVHLGALANIEARSGAVYFGAVVVLTMLAAMSFDPRLIWEHDKEFSDES